MYLQAKVRFYVSNESAVYHSVVISYPIQYNNEINKPPHMKQTDRWYHKGRERRHTGVMYYMIL